MGVYKRVGKERGGEGREKMYYNYNKQVINCCSYLFLCLEAKRSVRARKEQENEKSEESLLYVAVMKTA